MKIQQLWENGFSVPVKNLQNYSEMSLYVHLSKRDALSPAPIAFQWAFQGRSVSDTTFVRPVAIVTIITRISWSAVMNALTKPARIRNQK